VVERVEGWKVLDDLRPELWTRRPSFPTPAFLGDLRNATSFDDAVTRLARAQRGIKYMSAWCRMACSIVTDSKAPPVTLSSVPPADQYLMGVWLNNCEEKDGLTVYGCSNGRFPAISFTPSNCLRKSREFVELILTTLISSTLPPRLS